MIYLQGIRSNTTISIVIQQLEGFNSDPYVVFVILAMSTVRQEKSFAFNENDF